MGCLNQEIIVTACGFSDSQLRQAPLRLAHGSQSSIASGHSDIHDLHSKLVRYNDAGTEIEAQQKATQEQQSSRVRCEPTLPPHRIAPRLTALLSKFEVSQDVCCPRSQTLSHLANFASTKLPHRHTLPPPANAEGPSTTALPLMSTGNSITSSSKTGNHNLDGVVAATSSLASMIRDGPVSRYAQPTMKTDETNRDPDCHFEQRGKPDNQVSAKPQTPFPTADLGRRYKPTAELCRGKAEGPRGWGPVVVAERRKVFEQLSGWSSRFLKGASLFELA